MASAVTAEPLAGSVRSEPAVELVARPVEDEAVIVGLSRSQSSRAEVDRWAGRKFPEARKNAPYAKETRSAAAGITPRC
jgi:hypothetical protein